MNEKKRTKQLEVEKEDRDKYENMLESEDFNNIYNNWMKL